jgi:hypothetical protein
MKNIKKKTMDNNFRRKIINSKKKKKKQRRKSIKGGSIMENNWSEFTLPRTRGEPDRFFINFIKNEYYIKIIRRNGKEEYYRWIPDISGEDEDGEWLLLPEYPSSNKEDKLTGVGMPHPNKLIPLSKGYTELRDSGSSE